MGVRMADIIGQQRGNYRLTQLLGQGGFAEVYLGEHIHLGSKVAVKVLNTRLNQEGIQQFKQEALTLTHLTHPTYHKNTRLWF
jgi:eukaryotic-like serine/threonine-protein kinase